MRIETLVAGPFQVNTFLLWKEGQTRAVIIDPGDETDRLMDAITTEDLSLGTILATHAHIDHVGAIEDLRQWSGAVVCFPEGEREALRYLPDSCRFFGVPERPIPKVDHWLNPSSARLARIVSSDHLGGLEIVVHTTPGHSPGGVCYQIENHWFVGDTLFSGSVGRVDLPGGDWGALQGSLHFLMSLPDDTIVYPGHGPSTTIGRERRTNPFLLELD
ncbi:MAG: MBL fold metallo-hydrolase [Fidelibacterota bacterium]|nr:MAG: MBL fold metallo-hydrolase [Candidatus Neomarinimicrobiota bacterium]